MQEILAEAAVKRAMGSNDGEEATIAWIVGSSSSVQGDEPRVAHRNTNAVTAPIRAGRRKRSRRIRSLGRGVKVCHHTRELSFLCACFRFHSWVSRLGRADRPLHPLVPLRSHASSASPRLSVYAKS